MLMSCTAAFRHFCQLGFVATLAGTGAAGDWPGWRGPHGDGLSDEKEAPVKWSATENVLWKAESPGKGVGQPVIWGDRVFLTASDGHRHDQLIFFCLDRRDGRELWRRDFWGTAPTLRHEQKSSMATPTPVTDGKHVWAFFGTGDLFCLDLGGNLVWCRSLAQEYEPFQNRFAMGSSPVLVGDVLVLQCDHWGQSYLIGIDKRTGKNVWKTDRAEHVSWSSPLVIDVDGRKELVVAATFQVKGYDAATGRELWSAEGMTRECIPTAVAGDGLIFAVSGTKGETLAIRAGGRGDITETHVVWRNQRNAPFVPSAILVDDLYYLVDDKGIAACLEAATGKLVWQQRLGGAFSASPIAAGGKIYFVDEEGTTTVLAAGREFKVLGKNSLGEPAFASPAISRGDLLIRTDRHLYCIEGTERPAAR
jgi:outer membrane protein assembly factor BamB